MPTQHRRATKRHRSASPGGAPEHRDDQPTAHPRQPCRARKAPKGPAAGGHRRRAAPAAEVRRFADSDVFFTAVRAARQAAKDECDQVDAVRELLQRKEAQLKALPATTRAGVRAALQRAVNRARMRVRFLESEGPVHQLHRRIKPFVRHHYALLAAHERVTRRESAALHAGSDGDAWRDGAHLDDGSGNAFVLQSVDVAVDTERAAAKVSERHAASTAPSAAAGISSSSSAAVGAPHSRFATAAVAPTAMATRADEVKVASMTRLQRLAGVLASMVTTAQHDHAAAAPVTQAATAHAPAATPRSAAATASIQDVCPRCADHPTLRMDPVESVMLCPNPTCTYTRAFHSLMCPALTHEDRSASSRAGPNPTTEMYTTMQQCSGEEPRVVPRAVMRAIMQHLYDAGVPPEPHAVTYDVVTAALKALRLSTYYDQRTQIRARLTGIAPPSFTVQQKATIATLHAVTRHMQAWVDPARRAQNLQVRLIFLCQSMGWWEHIVAPRFVSGPEGSARYDAVNKLLHAALGWPHYTCAETQHNRGIAAAYAAKLEKAVAVPQRRRVLQSAAT